MARDAAAETGASKDDIDDLFGWLVAPGRAGQGSYVAKINKKGLRSLVVAGIAERSVRARWHHDDLMARGACPFGGSSLGHSVEWGVPARVCVRS